jgi:hypothetical protein
MKWSLSSSVVPSLPLGIRDSYPLAADVAEAAGIGHKYGRRRTPGMSRALQRVGSMPWFG